MTEKLLAALLFGIVVSAATAADTYRWEDEAGNVYYSDQLPPSGARNVQRTRQQGGAPVPALPYRLQVVVKSFPVTLYVSDCGQPCNKARELLLARGVPHTLLDASQSEAQESLMALTGGALEVPVIKIGKTVLRGFEDGQWNSALDAAGYPGYAIIEVQPDIPQPAEQAASQGSASGEAGTANGAELDSAEARTSDADSGELDGEGVETLDPEQ
jgi:hypothetical protein